MSEVEFELTILSAVCKCGAVFNAVVNLPIYCELTDDKGRVCYVKVAEHVVVKCPRCNRLLNVGNGSQRETKPPEKHEKGIYIIEGSNET